jgi:epsilon-lactone hydrolase
MPSPEAADVFRMNQQLLADWTSSPDATIDDFRRVFEKFCDQLEIPGDAAFEPVDAGGVPAIWATAEGADPSRVVLHFHSGGYVLGSAHGYRSFGARLSSVANARVLLVDYRLAPEHPHPAALEDAQRAYRWVLDQGFDPGDVSISGDSAGGGLVLATLQALRDDGDRLPAGAVAISPWADFSLSGESMTTNADHDPLVPGPDLLRMMVQMIIGDGDPADPRVSPLYGDWSRLPPLLVMAGSIETLRDDADRAVEAARKAGVDATFLEGDGMVHIWPIYADRLPEAREALARIGEFLGRHLGARSS